MGRSERILRRNVIVQPDQDHSFTNKRRCGTGARAVIIRHGSINAKHAQPRGTRISACAAMHKGANPAAAINYSSGNIDHSGLVRYGTCCDRGVPCRRFMAPIPNRTIFIEREDLQMAAGGAEDAFPWRWRHCAPGGRARRKSTNRNCRRPATKQIDFAADDIGRFWSQPCPALCHGPKSRRAAFRWITDQRH